MCSLSIRQFIWEYENEEVYLYIHFQLGNSFGNIKVKRDIHLYAFN